MKTVFRTENGLLIFGTGPHRTALLREYYATEARSEDSEVPVKTTSVFSVSLSRILCDSYWSCLGLARRARRSNFFVATKTDTSAMHTSYIITNVVLGLGFVGLLIYLLLQIWIEKCLLVLKAEYERKSVDLAHSSCCVSSCLVPPVFVSIFLFSSFFFGG